MSQLSITLNGRPTVMEADRAVELDNGSLTTADKLLVGDRIKVTRDMAQFIEEVEAVEHVPSLEECVESEALIAERRIQLLESRIETLETALIANNQAVQNFQRSIVELTAQHIETVFKDEVMIDTLAQRFFIAAANAIAHKAKNSRNRAPKLVVVDTMIPGCVIRAKLTAEGFAVIEMLDKEGVWATGDELPEQMRSEQIKTTFGNLLLSYGAEVDRAYFITEDVALEEYREAIAAEAQAVVKAVEEPVTTH
ncbi:hypothetical protein D9M68_19970 [compost metagenome]